MASATITVNLCVSDESAHTAAALLNLWLSQHPEKIILAHFEPQEGFLITKIKIDDMPEDMKP